MNVNLMKEDCVGGNLTHDFRWLYTTDEYSDAAGDPSSIIIQSVFFCTRCLCMTYINTPNPPPLSGSSVASAGGSTRSVSDTTCMKKKYPSCFHEFAYLRTDTQGSGKNDVFFCTHCLQQQSVVQVTVPTAIAAAMATAATTGDPL
jgi:hypothetical protein